MTARDVAGTLEGIVSSEVILRNGSPVHVRPIRPDDATGLLALCERLSERSRYLRFFTPRRLRPEEAHDLADVDHTRCEALVATATDAPDAPIVGVARYGPSGDGTAEIGLVVADAWQGLGLGTALLDRLLAEGEHSGIEEFSAEVLAENRQTLRLLSQHTVIARRSFSNGVVSLVFHRSAPLALVGKH
jgi:RimJ/RimL family protein N-acetyltransferase